MKELSFLISLKDNLTGKLAQAKKSVNTFAQSSREAFTKIGIGGAGLWGIVTGVKNLLAPAEQVKNALNALSVQNVSNPTLDKLYKDAQAFSTQFGQSATDYIQATQAIRKSLRGITDDELPRYTKAINTLSIASKSSTEQASQYMADMVNEYQLAAKTMGNIPFAQMMASKAAVMSQNFGVGLADIQKMIKDNPLSTKLNIGMDEQLAVMGSLNLTQGSHAGSVYNDFLANAAKGGKQLGVSLTNAKGELLTFPDILDKLQAKFGNTIDGNIKAQKALNAAFGNGAKALKDNWGQAAKLRQHMAQLGNTHGLDRSAEMAAKMANLWSRLDKVWERMRISLGSRLMPAIEPLANKLIGIGEQLAKWMDMFPNITRVVGYAVLGLLAFAAIGAALNIIMGVSKFILTGWKLAIVAWNLALKASIAFVWVCRGALMAWNITLRLLRGTLLAVQIAAWAAGLSFNFMSLPVLLIIGAIALLCAGVYLLIKYWDEIKAAIMETEAFKLASAAIEALGNVFTDVWAWIKETWQDTVQWFADFSLADTFNGLLDNVKATFMSWFNWLKNTFIGVYNSIVSKLNAIPGVEIDLLPTVEAPTLTTPSGEAIATLPTPPGGAMGAIAGAGIAKQLNTQNKNSTTKNETRVNTVNIYPQNEETFHSLLESQELNAG